MKMHLLQDFDICFNFFLPVYYSNKIQSSSKVPENHDTDQCTETEQRTAGRMALEPGPMLELMMENPADADTW